MYIMILDTFPASLNYKEEVEIMSGSTYGTAFSITTWGESHGKGIGVVIDGCPAGLHLTAEQIQAFLNRRKPGQSKYATPRQEGDQVEILSGVFQDITTGTPISLLVRNENQQSKDYSEIASYYRPGHADYTYDAKYGFRDYRGGGRSSGRETTGRVAAVAIASLILGELGIQIFAYTKSIGPIQIDYKNCSRNNVYQNPVCMPDQTAANAAQSFLDQQMSQNDSIGGVIECIVTGMPAGIGNPVFDKLDASLAKAILSIGAIKGIEFGSGFEVATLSGSENNDAYRMNNQGKVVKATNHAGGILGGMSDGSEIVLRAAVKPTPSIYKTQQTVNQNHEEIEVNIKGRNDPIIVPRAVVVVESMVAITIVDALFTNMSSRLDKIKAFYQPE